MPYRPTGGREAGDHERQRRRPRDNLPRVDPETRALVEKVAALDRKEFLLAIDFFGGTPAGRQRGPVKVWRIYARAT
jgi:hypothetical protein